MDFEMLGLHSQPKLLPFTRQDGLWLSDISFANMYMWRHSREISFCFINDFLVIQTRYPNANPFIFFPLKIEKQVADNALKSLILTFIDYYAKQNLPLEMHSLQSNQIEMLQGLFPQAFIITQRRDRFDYIYHLPELIGLTGRKYHKKKNHINRFYLQYPNVSYESIDEHNINDVLATNNAWFKADSREDSGLAFENLGINDALNAFYQLGLKGGLLRFEDEIIAFSFGEERDDKMALIHIEKANTSFSGAYQAINQSLLKNEFSHLLYANREEDLGIEGLRKAKLSYQPAFLLEKYDVRFKT